MNISIFAIASVNGATIVGLSHSRGTLTSSNATAAQANAGVISAGIGSLTFNGGAANAERADNLVQTVTQGQGTLGQVYQSTHQNDLIGTLIGGNAPTGGTDLGLLGVGDAHSTYAPGRSDHNMEDVWGSPEGNIPERVNPPWGVR